MKLLGKEVNDEIIYKKFRLAKYFLPGLFAKPEFF